MTQPLHANLQMELRWLQQQIVLAIMKMALKECKMDYKLYKEL